MLETFLLIGMMVQAPEFNPCQAPTEAPSTNPDTVYFYNEALADPTWANQATVTVHREVSPPTATAPAVMENEPRETMTITISGANSTPYPNCFKMSYTPGPGLVRDGQTRYRVKTRASHSTGLRGPEGGFSNPFVLTPVGQRPIPVTETRVGRTL
jgi:hypothetical protein